MNSAATGRRFVLPPWPLIPVQLSWVFTLIAFLYLAVIWRSVSHVVMAVLSAVLLIGIHYRSRVAFWGSALVLAASLGGTVARIIQIEAFPLVLAANLAIGVVLLVLHQVPISFRWFAFQSSFRKIRLGFWVLAAIICVVGEFAFVILTGGA